MSQSFDRIDSLSSPEAIFQNLRRWAITTGVDISVMPLYDFGHLLNVNADAFIGSDAFLEAAKSWSALVAHHGFRLPHPACAFLLRYAPTAETPPFMLLSVGLTQGTATNFRWFQWSLSDGWIMIASARVSGIEDFAFRLANPRASETEARHYRNTYFTALSAGLNLIYDRADAVEKEPRAPQATKGRTKVHPLAPSNVIVLKVNRERLASRPVEQETEENKRKVAPHNRAGSMPLYQHPRYKNVRGTRRPRAGASVNGGAQEAKTYRVTT